MIKLSKRLQAIADMVTEGSRLADVGTDHGYIPVYLCQTGKIASALAMDVNRGPLKRAEEHIRDFGLEGYIQTRLSDGLSALNSGEADSVVIAGMGGGLVIRILRDAVDKLPEIRELILQPQSEIREVRRFLRENGFSVIDEQMLVEDGKYYTVIRGVHGNADPEYNIENMELADTFGPVLLQKKHPVLKEWILRELEISGHILEQLQGAGQGESARERRREVEQRCKLLRLALWE